METTSWLLKIFKDPETSDLGKDQCNLSFHEKAGFCDWSYQKDNKDAVEEDAWDSTIISGILVSMSENIKKSIIYVCE